MAVLGWAKLTICSLHQIFLQVIGPYKNVKQEFSQDSNIFTGLYYRTWTITENNLRKVIFGVFLSRFVKIFCSSTYFCLFVSQITLRWLLLNLNLIRMLEWWCRLQRNIFFLSWKGLSKVFWNSLGIAKSVVHSLKNRKAPDSVLSSANSMYY